MILILSAIPSVKGNEESKGQVKLVNIFKHNKPTTMSLREEMFTISTLPPDILIKEEHKPKLLQPYEIVHSEVFPFGKFFQTEHIGIHYGCKSTMKRLLSNGEYYSPCCCLLYTSPSPRDGLLSRMPSSA